MHTSNDSSRRAGLPPHLAHSLRAFRTQKRVESVRKPPQPHRAHLRTCRLFPDRFACFAPCLLRIQRELVGNVIFVDRLLHPAVDRHGRRVTHRIPTPQLWHGTQTAVHLLLAMTATRLSAVSGAAMYCTSHRCQRDQQVHHVVTCTAEMPFALSAPHGQMLVAFPALVRIEPDYLLCCSGSIRTEILFVNCAIMIDEESHYTRITV